MFPRPCPRKSLEPGGPHPPPAILPTHNPARTPGGRGGYHVAGSAEFSPLPGVVGSVLFQSVLPSWLGQGQHPLLLVWLSKWKTWPTSLQGEQVPSTLTALYCWSPAPQVPHAVPLPGSPAPKMSSVPLQQTYTALKPLHPPLRGGLAGEDLPGGKQMAVGGCHVTRPFVWVAAW